ncbi:MAG TPA: hypothetical protein VN960_08800 [Gaiellaceae bacterium]|jgi:Ca2+-binding RTX toxin-like protein|nr:hypothetical protein [Gaiellaceae bacterium]
MGGRRIALIRQTGSDAELFVVEANGKNLKQLTTAGAGGPPAWTRDGSRIAYLHGGDIWLVNRDGTNPVNLTETPEPVEATPRFSPDGSLLLFNRIVSFGEGDAFLLDLATGTETNLTNSPMVLDGAVTWSPDGEKILGNGPTTGLFVMDADGTDVIPLGAGTAPDWQPHCTITGTAAAERLVGSSERDVICGLGGADVIRGGGGDDVVFGGGGDDRLVGGVGDDKLVGQAGNDLLAPGTGDDLVVGDVGIDTVSFSAATAGIVLSLAGGSAGGEGCDVIISIENVAGSPRRGSLTGSSRSNTLSGAGGADRLLGGKGADRLFGRRGNDFLSGELGNDSLNGGAGMDTCRQGPGTGPRRGCER